MNILGHFKTITRHRHAVMKNCFKVGIGFRGLFHDLSKYSFSEFIPGARYYQATRSPNERERELNGYSAAWMHHKGRNRHHIEYWTDYDPVTKQIRPVKMPIKYVKEMFCDRVAASKIYYGKNYTDATAYEYFMRGKPHRVIEKETSDLIESWLKMLADKGEKETFNYVKNYKG